MTHNDLILGTAGHIDHGKTSLIRALTGVDTDRLPEEQKRGITIELGFAHLEIPPYRFGVVDVPGHEKFVRNMLSGATGMDCGLLVVAANDSIKQQTREHLDILKLLQLPIGVVAITKCDLVEQDWLELVEDEIRDLVRGTCLESAEIVRTSSATGEGLSELRTALRAAAETAIEMRSASLQAPFRMAIDRTFTIAGHGTVVTGSVVSGTVRQGDELEVAPGQIKVRVRGLQNHDRSTDEVHRGQRAAINLVGIHHDETQRGQELIAPGSLVPSQRLTVRLHHLPAVPRPLRNRARVRLHLGTSEQLAVVRLLDRNVLEANQTAWVQLHLSEPVVASWRQPFVVRTESPVQTIGGGIVADPEANRIKVLSDGERRALEGLESVEPQRRVEAALALRGFRPWKNMDLFRLSGVDDPGPMVDALESEGVVVPIELSPQRTLRVHRDVIQGLSQQIIECLGRLHDSQPLRLVFPLSELAKRFDYLPDRKVLHRAIAELRQEKRLRSTDKGVGLANRGPKLSQNEVKLLDQLVRDIKEAAATPPTVKQLQEATPKNKESVAQLLQLGVGQGELVEVAQGLFYHRDVVAQMWNSLAKEFERDGGLTVSAIKDRLGFSRKYAVPFCEYLDQAGFTRREGDLRFPRQELAVGEQGSLRGNPDGEE